VGRSARQFIKANEETNWTFVAGTGHAFEGTVSTRRLGNSDLNITPVGFGAWAIGATGYDLAWGKQASRGSTRELMALRPPAKSFISEFRHRLQASG
jgi:hypothetical protein